MTLMTASAVDFFLAHPDDGITAHMLSFLGVRSLVRFTSCTKTLQPLLAPEVERRRELFNEYEARVGVLLNEDYFEEPMPPVHLRQHVLEAERLYQKARALIDSELNWLDRFEPPAVEQDKLFSKERARLVASKDDDSVFAEFFMLPRCSYIPPGRRETLPPLEEHYDMARSSLRKTWIKARENQFDFYKAGMGADPYYGDPKFPFRKFDEWSGSRAFREHLWEVISDITELPLVMVQAFRMAAKQAAETGRHVRDAFYYILHHVDLELADRIDTAFDSGEDEESRAFQLVMEGWGMW